jgi:hypothetical protein
MIREERFLLSKNQFALDLASMNLGPAEPRWDGTLMASCSISAVWYRSKKGVLRACTGYLHDIVTPPITVDEFLAGFLHDPWGGQCAGRWDGTSYYSHNGSVPEVQAQHMAILAPMLDSVPLIPPSYDGWWRFLTSREREKLRLAQ